MEGLRIFVSEDLSTATNVQPIWPFWVIQFLRYNCSCILDLALLAWQCQPVQTTHWSTFISSSVRPTRPPGTCTKWETLLARRLVAASQHVLHASLGVAKHTRSKGPFSLNDCHSLAFLLKWILVSDILVSTAGLSNQTEHFNLISQDFKMHCLAELKTGGSSNASAAVWKVNPSIVLASMTCLMLS